MCVVASPDLVADDIVHPASIPGLGVLGQGFPHAAQTSALLVDTGKTLYHKQTILDSSDEQFCFMGTFTGHDSNLSPHLISPAPPCHSPTQYLATKGSVTNTWALFL